MGLPENRRESVGLAVAVLDISDIFDMPEIVHLFLIFFHAIIERMTPSALSSKNK